MYTALSQRKARTEQLVSEVRELLATPVVREALGVRGVWLAEVAKWAYVPDVHEGWIGDIKDRNAFPVLLLHSGEMVESDATDMMLSQRNHLSLHLQDYWQRRGAMYDTEEIAAQADQLADIQSGLCLTLSARAEQARTMLGTRPAVVDDVDLEVTTVGRPHVVVRADGPAAALPYRLLHEYSHVLDDILAPYRPSDEILHRKRLLSTELAAFATSAVALEASRTERTWWQRRTGYRLSAVEADVERIRRSVNGDYTSPRAFEPNDEVEERLLRKNLGFIYQQYQL